MEGADPTGHHLSRTVVGIPREVNKRLGVEVNKRYGAPDLESGTI